MASGGTIFQNIPRYLTGITAIALCLFFLGKENSPPVFLALIFFSLICATDTFFTKIPNVINLALIVGGFSYNFLTSGAPGLLTAFLGLLLGLSLLIIPYAMGGMGAGDVKALAALGSLLGPAVTFQVFLYTGLIGGVMAILHYAFNRNLLEKVRQGFNALLAFALTSEASFLRPSSEKVEKLRFPYAAAITFGFIAQQHWGALI